MAGHPDVFPAGSILFIEDLGYRIVGDTGTFIYWKDGRRTLDVYIGKENGHKEAYQYGVKIKKVIFIRWGWDDWTGIHVEDYLGLGQALSKEAVKSGRFLKVPFSKTVQKWLFIEKLLK